MSTDADYPRLGQAIILVLVLLAVQIVIGVAVGIALFISGLRLLTGDPAVIGICNAVSFAIVLMWACRKAEEPLLHVFALRPFHAAILPPLMVLLIGLGICQDRLPVGVYSRARLLQFAGAAHAGRAAGDY